MTLERFMASNFHAFIFLIFKNEARSQFPYQLHLATLTPFRFIAFRHLFSIIIGVYHRHENERATFGVFKVSTDTMITDKPDVTFSPHLHRLLISFVFLSREHRSGPDSIIFLHAFIT